MDRDSLLHHLDEALRRAAKGEALIARQRQLLAELARKNEDTFLAQWLLEMMETLQQQYIGHAERIRRQLDKQQP